MQFLHNAFRRGAWQIASARFSRAGLYCIEVDCPTNGFFSQLGGLMPILLRCERRNLKPHIILSSKLYLERGRGPSFLQYFFDGPIFTETQRSLIRRSSMPRFESFAEIYGWSREDYPRLADSGTLFRRYYSLRQQIKAEADAFAAVNFKAGATLGVHYRGTDKVSEASFVPFEHTLQSIRQYITSHPEIKVVFVSADIADYIDFIRHSLPDVRIIYRNSEARSTNALPIHLSRIGSPYQNALDALLNCLLLSKCDVLFKTMSNLSGWAKVFNPSLKVYLMNRPDNEGIKWLGFPEREMVEKQWFTPQLPLDCGIASSTKI